MRKKESQIFSGNGILKEGPEEELSKTKPEAAEAEQQKKERVELIENLAVRL